MAQILFAGLGQGAIYAIFALGLVLVFKTTGVLNLSQGEMGTFAAFMMWTFIKRWHLSLGQAGAIGVFIVALIAIAFERLVVRPLIADARMKLVVATAAAASFLGGLELKLWGSPPHLLPPLSQAKGIAVAGVVVTPARLLAIGVAISLSLLLGLFLRYTTFGLAVLAFAEDPDGVRMTGIRIRNISRFVWIASSCIGAVGGILTAMAFGAFAPFFMSRIMLLGFAAAVLGGLRSLPGAVVGGVIVGIGDAAASRHFLSVPGAVPGLVFAVIVLALLFRPQGLFGRA